MARRTLVLLLAVAVLVSVSVVVAAESTKPVVREIVNQRNGNTRVWEVSRQVPVVNDATGLTETVTVKNQVYEKADNLCYNKSETDTPDWVPTVEAITQVSKSGIAYEAKQGGYQVSFAGDLSASGGAPWSIIYKAKNQTIRLGVKYLGYYDSSNGSSVFLTSVASVVPQLVASNRLIYRNAFPGIDIEYVYTKGAFLQNAVINSVSSYQSPSHYGLNPASTQLIVATEMDLGEESALKLEINNQRYTGTALKAGNYPIIVSNSNTNNPICNFAPNQAFDNSSVNSQPVEKVNTRSGNTIAVQQRLVELNGRHYLIEGIPMPWLNAAALPVTIDYNLKSGGISGNETWLSGKTYFISGPVTVNNGGILAIEPNTICKYTTSSEIDVAAGGTIIARGDKFNYLLFTSWNDNSIGETITGSSGSPQPYDYAYGICLQTNASSTSRIEYCKFSYGYAGVVTFTKVDNPIQNNIFRNQCSGAILITGNGSNDGVSLNNNLIVSSYENTQYGICVDGSDDEDPFVSAVNNTIDGPGMGNSGMGFCVYDESLSQSFVDCKNNLISNWDYGLVAVSGEFGTHSYNKFYDVSVPWEGTSQETGETAYSSEYYSLPYDRVNSPNGSYYLDQTINQYVGAGDGSASNYGELTTKTTVKPAYKANDISASETWQKVQRDEGNIDVGYHYDPVDIVIQPTQNNLIQVTNAAHLTINPGVVVSFYRTSGSHESKLKIYDDALLTAAGDTTNYIQFTSIYATSDELQTPFRGGLDTYDYSAGIILHTQASTDSDIQYCDFKYANTGIRELERMNLNRPIQNNYFSQNIYGIAFDSSANNVVNNLFEKNKFGVAIRLYELGNQSPEPKIISYIQSNTFFKNDTALWVLSTTVSGQTTIVRIEDNIFVSNYAGCIGSTLNNGYIFSETRNNLYWGNDTNVDGSRIVLNTSNTENKDIINDSCPMLVHKARLNAGNGERIEKYPHDGFYLAQRTDDASRYPFQIKNLASSNGIDASHAHLGSYMNVYVYNNMAQRTMVGCYGYGSYYDGYSALTAGNVLIELVGCSTAWSIVAGDYLILSFGNNVSLDTIKVYLPSITMQPYQTLELWVALDGSTYYGDKNRSSTWQLEQDAWFAMEYDMPRYTGRNDTGLAQSAYNSGGRSKAVDKGAVKVTTLEVDEEPKTYTYSIFASTGGTKTDGSTLDSGTIYRAIPPSLPTNTADPVGRLDLGYHYNGSVVYTTDVMATLETEVQWYGGQGTKEFSFDEYNEFILNEKTLTSGAFNTSTLIDTTMVLYPVLHKFLNNGNTHLLGAGYHETNTPINGLLGDGISDKAAQIYTDQYPWDEQLALTSSPTNGDIFAARAIWAPELGGANVTQKINIYRYRNDLKDWLLIATYIPNEDREYIQFLDISLATDGTDVWVTWKEQNSDSGDYSYIKAAIVPAYPGSPTSISVINTLVTLPYWSPPYYESEPNTADQFLDLTYDGNYEDGRLIFVDDNYSPQHIRVGRFYTDRIYDTISFNPFDPYDLSNSDNGISPRIAFNPNDPTDSEFRAYSAYSIRDEYNNYTGKSAHLNAQYPDDEYWVDEGTFTYPNDYPDVTYQANGAEFLVWAGSNKIESNHGTIYSGSGNLQYPRVDTNALNNRDIYALWPDEYDNQISVMVRELLP